jgi:hypothetical protein
MSQKSERLSRQIATMVGNAVTKTSTFVIDNGEDLAISLLQRVARSNVGRTVLQQNTATVVRAANTFRKLSFLIPLVAGRVAATTTYVGMRTGLGVASQARNIIMRLLPN